MCGFVYKSLIHKAFISHFIVIDQNERLHVSRNNGLCVRIDLIQ